MTSHFKGTGSRAPFSHTTPPSLPVLRPFPDMQAHIQLKQRHASADSLSRREGAAFKGPAVANTIIATHTGRRKGLPRGNCGYVGV